MGMGGQIPALFSQNLWTIPYFKRAIDNGPQATDFYVSWAFSEAGR